MLFRTSHLLTVVAVALLVVVSGCSPSESSLEIADPWARAADAGAMPAAETTPPAGEQTAAMGQMMTSGGAVSAAYMTIRNTGGIADRLVGGSTPAAAIVEIHTVEMQGDVMRMRPLPDGLEIPAGGTVSLEPGGYHVMLMDLLQTLVAGESVPLTLNFASGKTITVQAEIRAP